MYTPRRLLGHEVRCIHAPLPWMWEDPDVYTTPFDRPRSSVYTRPPPSEELEREAGSPSEEELEA